MSSSALHKLLQCSSLLVVFAEKGAFFQEKIRFKKALRSPPENF
jgi:hypothetical protein